MGTKRERAKGVWQLRVAAGVDPVDGRRRVVTETFRGSERAADARLSELEVDVASGHRRRTNQTLRATITAWRTVAKHAPGTARNYDTAMAAIPAHLLKTSIGKITADTLRELYDRTTAQYGVHRTRAMHAVISGALTHAWRQEWIPGNVARRVQPPSQPKRRAGAPSTEVVGKLLELVEAKPEFYAWVLTSAMIGGRRSEILALRWSDVDLDRGEISITKAIDPITGELKLTKTEDERIIAIGAELVAALRRWRVAFLERAMAVGAKPVPNPFVFVRSGCWDGAIAWRPDTGTKRFGKIRDTAGVKWRLHDLRHYMATTLLGAGVAPKTVSERVGHKRLATTTDLYGHAIPASDRAAADILERGLSGRRN